MISQNSQANGPVYAVVISEKGGAERREVFEATELSVGRVQGNDLMLPKGNVSKRHARLLYRDGRFIVTDLNSTNGTYVNRRRIAQATIVREGDRIYIGDFVLRIELMDGLESPSNRVSSGPVPSAHPSGGASDNVARSLESQPTPGRLTSSRPADSPPRVSSPGQADDEVSGQIRVVRVGSTTPKPERSISTVRDETDRDTLAVRGYLKAVFEKSVAALEIAEREMPPDDAARVRSVLERELGAAGEPPASLTSEHAREYLESEFLGLGPLRVPLDDPSMRQIVVSRFDRIVVVSEGGRAPLPIPFSSPRSAAWTLTRLCKECGVTSSPTVEVRLPDGSSLSALDSSAPDGPVMSIRRAQRRDESLEHLVRRGTISRAIATFLHQCVLARSNVLVVGTHDSGADGVLGALCQAGDDTTLFVVEAFDRLVQEQSRVRRVSARAPDLDLARLLRMAVRLPTTRVVADMSDPGTAVDVLNAISEGADGVLAYLPANSFRRALARLSASLAVERGGVTADQTRDWIAATFDLVLEVARLRDGRARVLRVAELSKLDDPEAPGRDIFTFLVERTAAGGAVEGAFAPSGVLPKLIDELTMRGVSVDTSMFTRPPSR